MPGSLVKMALANSLPKVTSNLSFPDVCLLSSWYYRREPPHLTICDFWMMWQICTDWEKFLYQSPASVLHNYKTALFLLLLLLLSWWDWGLNSGLHTCKAGALLLQPHLQFILLWLFLEIGSHDLLALSTFELPSSQSQSPKELRL
jgi:hypothetical protein